MLFQKFKCKLYGRGGPSGDLASYSTNTEWKIAPNMEADIGFNFVKNFRDGKEFVNITLGYSFIAYFNQVKPISYLDSYNNRGIGLMAWTGIRHSAINNYNLVDTATLFMHGIRAGVEFCF